MGHFLGFAPVSLLQKTSFFVLSIFSVSVRDVAESLSISGSARLFPSETQGSSRHSLFSNKLKADVHYGARARRYDVSVRSPVYALEADLPSAFLLINPAVSRSDEAHVKERPALSVVNLGLFEVINPLPEDDTKILDLSWLAQVVIAKEEAESSAVTEPLPSTSEADRGSGIDGSGRAANQEKRAALPPENDNTNQKPNGGGQSPGPPHEYPTGPSRGMEDLDSRDRPAHDGRPDSPSGASLADAIEATGDKNLIEVAGLDGRNPWKLVDEADAMDRERKGGLADQEDRDRMPAGEISEGARKGRGPPPTKERDRDSQKVPKLPEETESDKEKPASPIFVGKAIRVDATYIFEGSAGSLHVRYGADAPKLCRTVLIENISSETVRVFSRMTDANFVPENVNTPLESGPGVHSGASSFLENSAHFLKGIFLQLTSRLTTPPDSQHRADALNPSLTSVEELMEQLRQSREDRPGKPSDLLLNLVEDDLSTDGSTSGILDTERGAKAVEGLRQLMEKTFGQRKQAVQVLKTLRMIIVSFPYGDESEARVKEVLESIRHLCDGLISRWSFPGEVTITSRISSDSPSSPKPAHTSDSSKSQDAVKSPTFTGTLPEDPELQQKLYGMFMTNISSAWMHGETGKGVVVAVLDTGVSSHEELSCNFWINSGETGSGSDTDGNGLPDDLRGYNFDEDRGDPEDENGHGTHIAGTIAACANGLGVVGGSFGAKMMSLRFMDKDGSGAVAGSIRGVAYAIDQGAHILNNSWGGPDEAPQLQWVLNLTAQAHGGKGILIVNAAGNESVDNDITPSYPANWKTENSISVAAVDQNGQLADFSNWGRQTVELAAPGVRIYSTAPGSEFQYLSGTSMATPHVSAVAALVYGAFFKNNYHPSASEVKDILRLTVKKLPSLEGVVAWGGIPNAKDAVLMARMGGMWAQSACEDMIVDVPPGTARAIKIFFNGYRAGTYRANLTFDVFDEQQSRVERIQIPFSLISSRQPPQNKHTDAEGADAFATVPNLEVPSEEEDNDDLCRLQVKFLNLGEGLPLWAIILLAAAGTIVMLALVIGCIILQRRGYWRNGQPEILNVPRELHCREDAYR